MIPPSIIGNTLHLSHQARYKRGEPQYPSDKGTPVEPEEVPVRRGAVGTIKVINAKRLFLHKEVVAEEYTHHRTEEDRPPREDGDERRGLSYIVPWTYRNAYYGNNVAPASDIDVLGAKCSNVHACRHRVGDYT